MGELTGRGGGGWGSGGGGENGGEGKASGRGGRGGSGWKHGGATGENGPVGYKADSAGSAKKKLKSDLHCNAALAFSGIGSFLVHGP